MVSPFRRFFENLSTLENMHEKLIQPQNLGLHMSDAHSRFLFMHGWNDRMFAGLFTTVCPVAELPENQNGLLDRNAEMSRY